MLAYQLDSLSKSAVKPISSDMGMYKAVQERSISCIIKKRAQHARTYTSLLQHGRRWIVFCFTERPKSLPELHKIFLLYNFNRTTF